MGIQHAHLTGDSLNRRILNTGIDWAKDLGIWCGGGYGLFFPVLFYLFVIVDIQDLSELSNEGIWNGILLFFSCGAFVSIPVGILTGRIIGKLIGFLGASTFIIVYRGWSSWLRSVVRLDRIEMVCGVLAPLILIGCLLFSYYALQQNPFFLILILLPSLLIALLTPFGARNLLRSYENELTRGIQNV